MTSVGQSLMTHGSRRCPRSPEALDKPQVAVLTARTPWTCRNPAGAGRGVIRFRRVRDRGGLRGLPGVSLEQVARAFQIRLAAGTQEPVGSDFGEAPGEDVLEESPDEDIGRQDLAPRLA